MTAIQGLEEMRSRLAGHTGAEGSPPNAEPGLRLDGVRVLLVEDDEDSRDLLATILEEAGAEVVAVARVEEVLERLAEATPDVLLSDIGLPGEEECQP